MTAGEAPPVAVARLVLAAVESARAALLAVDTALSTAGELGVPAPGFAQLMSVRQPLAGLIGEHGAAVVLSRNEITANGGTP